MKKIIFFFLLTVFVTETLNAQTRTRRSTPQRRRVPVTAFAEFQSILGQNQLNIPQGQVTFRVDGAGVISQVMFRDKTGKTLMLVPSTPADTKAKDTGCKNVLPDACFVSPDKTIGMIICRPNNGAGAAKVSYAVEELVEE